MRHTESRLSLCWFAAALVAALATCGAEEPFVPVDDPAAFEIDATVRFLEVGCWAFVTDSVPYEIRELPETHRRDGLRVRASVMYAEGQFTVCQIGPVLEVLSVARR